MAEQLSDDEMELLRKHRAAKAKKAGRKVTVRGKHDSGAEYSFDLDGDEAERIISRHRALWADEDEDGEGQDGDGEDGEGDGDGGEDDAGGAGGGAGGAGGGKKPAARKGPYFKKG